MSFDWNRGRAFLATAEHGSLSAAARALGLPVILADRPVLPGEVAANDVTEVMHWLHHTALRGV